MRYRCQGQARSLSSDSASPEGDGGPFPPVHGCFVPPLRSGSHPAARASAIHANPADLTLTVRTRELKNLVPKSDMNMAMTVSPTQLSGPPHPPDPSGPAEN